MQFIVCNLGRTAGGGGLGAATTKDCATQAGLAWDGDEGLATCASGPEDFSILMDPVNYADNILAAVQRFKDGGYSLHVGVPWIFVNDDFLGCTGAACTVVRTPSGNQPLPELGSFLFLVCSKLDPRPVACAGVGPGAPTAATAQPTPACENCASLGSYSWSAPRTSAAPALVLAAAVLAALTCIAMRAVWQLGRMGRAVAAVDGKPGPVPE